MRRLALLTALSLVATASWAQTQVLPIESLEQAWQYAEQHNWDVQINTFEAEQAKRERQAVRSGLIPTVSATGSSQQNMELATTFLPGEIVGQPGTVVPTQLGQEFAYNAGVIIQKNFTATERVQTQQAKQNLQVVEAQHALYEQNLREQVAANYYTAQIAQQALELSLQDLALADSIAALTAKKLAQGTTDRLALNQAIMNRNSVKQTLNGYEQLLDQSLRSLTWLLGVPDSVTLTVSAGTDLAQGLPLQPLTGTDATIKVYETQRESAMLEVRNQQSRYLPTLSGQLYYGLQQFSNESGLDFGDEAWSDYQYATLSVSIPIFSGGQRMHKVQSAKVGEELAQSRLERAQQEASMQEAQLLADYYNSQENAVYLKENLQLMQESRTLAQYQLQQGLVPLDTYLRIFEDTLRAEQAYLTALTSQYGYYAQLIAKVES
ncbi:MAG: TolC family protein, partial [Bacteroidota bacterium]